ncbi:MAG: hypothetical protein DRP56_04845, partial [Planctomycetota bacterium]
MNIQDMITSGMAINRSQAQDQRMSIPYRPQYTAIAGGRPASAILLQQISYWWSISKCKPFYKFKAPCSHDAYKEGDSWCEELGFSTGVFDTAIRHIGKKITKGVSKTEARKTHLVIYWIDRNRVTWYQLNEELFGLASYLAYESPDLLSNKGFTIYIDTNGFRYFIDKQGSNHFIDKPETTPFLITE